MDFSWVTWIGELQVLNGSLVATLLLIFVLSKRFFLAVDIYIQPDSCCRHWCCDFWLLQLLFIFLSLIIYFSLFNYNFLICEGIQNIRCHDHDCFWWDDFFWDCYFEACNHQAQLMLNRCISIASVWPKLQWQLGYSLKHEDFVESKLQLCILRLFWVKLSFYFLRSNSKRTSSFLVIGEASIALIIHFIGIVAIIVRSLLSFWRYVALIRQMWFCIHVECGTGSKEGADVMLFMCSLLLFDISCSSFASFMFQRHSIFLKASHCAGIWASLWTYFSNWSEYSVPWFIQQYWHRHRLVLILKPNKGVFSIILFSSWTSLDWILIQKLTWRQYWLIGTGWNVITSAT